MPYMDPMGYIFKWSQVPSSTGLLGRPILFLFWGLGMDCFAELVAPRHGLVFFGTPKTFCETCSKSRGKTNNMGWIQMCLRWFVFLGDLFKVIQFDYILPWISLRWFVYGFDPMVCITIFHQHFWGIFFLNFFPTSEANRRLQLGGSSTKTTCWKITVFLTQSHGGVWFRWCSGFHLGDFFTFHLHFQWCKWFPEKRAVDGSEIPNNHLGFLEAL